MGKASRYWQRITMDGMGNRQVEESAIAKTFFQHQFPDEEAIATSDSAIQRQLFQIYRSSATEQATLAEWCLRCFISHQSDRICHELIQRFGQTGGFVWSDLYCLVLDATGLERRGQADATASPYTPIATKILQTFDPDRGQLSTWTKRLVVSALNDFLLECGIYLISDWSLLNGMEPGQLVRLLRRVYQLPEAECHRMACLLAAYHGVYRSDRLRQSNARYKYQPPTNDQLNRMVTDLQQQGITGYSAQHVLQELHHLAQQIRRARQPEHLSLDNPEHRSLVEQSAQVVGNDDRPSEFLMRYRQALLDCLQQSFQQVITARITHWQRKKPPRDRLFLIALHQLHCQGMAMGAIALSIGLQRQDQVTRLLGLKELRADVRHILLQMLRDRLRNLAADYTDATRLAEMDHQLDALLSEQIDTLMTRATEEASTPNRLRTSLFAHRLCHYLDSLI